MIRREGVDFRINEEREPVMEALFAWIAEDEAGEEYIIGADLGAGPMPLVTSNQHLALRMQHLAESHAKEYKNKVHLFAFSGRRNLITVE